MLKPHLTDMVVYVGKLGLNTHRAAAVNCTKATLHPDGVKGGFVPDLDSEMHVHLTVFTPNDKSPVFVEYNVPFSANKKPGTWHWSNEDWNN